MIDTHLHLWDLERGSYEWLGPQHGALHRSFHPDEAERELAATGVRSAVLVQAEDSIEDTRYLLDVAARRPWVLGVVGWVRLDEPETAERQLAELDDPALLGIRHLVHDDPRADFLDLDTVRRSLRLLADAGLTFDVPDAWPGHLEAAARVADHHRDLVLVIDHLAKPPRGGSDLPDWEKALREIAERPNVVAKVSGLQRAGQPFTASALRPVFTVALEAFGVDRLMFGSDWPMTIDQGGYAAAHAVARDLFDELSTAEQHALWSRTASTIYRRRLDV